MCLRALNIVVWDEETVINEVEAICVSSNEEVVFTLTKERPEGSPMPKGAVADA